MEGRQIEEEEEVGKSRIGSPGSNEIMEEKVKLVLKTKGNLKSNIPKLTHSKS